VPDIAIHNLVVDSDSQRSSQTNLRNEIAALGVLNEDSDVVESLASEPSTQRLTGTVKGTYAAKVARELEEIGRASGVDTAAVYRDDGTAGQLNGYYSISTVDTGPADPREERLQSVDISWERAGTRASKWRAVETNLDQLQNDFGTSTSAEIGVPATASKVRWFNATTGGREDATLVTTRSSQFGDVEIYDAQAAPWDHPTLTFDVDYGEEWPTQARVWDDRGHADKLDANGDVQWAKVYATDHDPEGLFLVDNGLLRLTFNTGGNTLFAEEWDDSAGAWSTVSLDSSNWELFDVDLTRIGQGRVEGQVEFRDATQSPTAYFALNCRLGRGATDAQWTVPPGESGTTPSGLQTRLDPIASTSIVSPTETWGLTDRSEVRK
jgi:hypothetical protein